MKFRHLNAAFAVALLACFSHVNAIDEVRPVHLEWQAVEGIEKYKVQIRSHEYQLTTTKVTRKKEIDLNLPPGKYEFRVGTMNKFSKVSGWSDWQPLEIRRSEDPVLHTLSPAMVVQGTKTATIIVQADNVSEASKFILSGSGHAIPIKNKKLLPSGAMQYTIDLSKAPVGFYEARLENAGKHAAVEANMFEIAAKGATRSVRPGQAFAFAPGVSMMHLNDSAISADPGIGLTLDSYFHSLGFVGISPGIKISWFSLQGVGGAGSQLTGTRFDAFISYSLPLGRRFGLNLAFGGGIANVRLQSGLSFREDEVFGGLDFRYNLRRQVALFAGVEGLMLRDPGGTLMFIMPRVGLMRSF